MALTGTISTEVGVQVPAAKFFDLFTKQLHHVQNISERVHGAKLHEGDDWHSSDSVKHWTYVIDGKITTCKESIEAIDEQNKSIIYNLFDGDISQHYKVFKVILQVTEKNDGGASVKWAVEYEKINEDVEPPYGFLEFCDKSTKDIDGHLLNA